jgi:hypothetical protein
MAKQTPKTLNTDPMSTDGTLPEKPRRARSGGATRRAEAQASATADLPATEETFAARTTVDVRQSVDADSFDERFDSIASSPSEEDIRLRAYHRYLERGSNHGLDFEDWLEAERELKESKVSSR